MKEKNSNKHNKPHKDSYSNLNDNLNNLKQKIENFKDEQKNKDKQTSVNRQSNFAIIYRVFADLLAGVIVAFILNNIYIYFFEKNTIVFILLLTFCITGGLYNTIKFFYIKTNR